MGKSGEGVPELESRHDIRLGQLSGGEAKRVSLAAELLGRPRLLVIDEATSSLDSESESLVQQALETLMEGRTSIIIAHRLATVRRADCISVIRDGEVVEAGREAGAVALRSAGRRPMIPPGRSRGATEIERNGHLGNHPGDADPASAGQKAGALSVSTSAVRCAPLPAPWQGLLNQGARKIVLNLAEDVRRIVGGHLLEDVGGTLVGEVLEGKGRVWVGERSGPPSTYDAPEPDPWWAAYERAVREGWR